MEAKDGDKVRATTIPSLEYDEEARQVEGILATRYVPVLGYVKCWVDGQEVDPSSVVLSQEK